MRFVLVFLTCLAAFAQDVVYISNVRILDGTGTPATRGSVVVRGDRVERIGPNLTEPPAGARVIPGAGLTVLPGLFDLHTHLPYSGVSGVVGDWPKILAAYLVSGVTTVADFGTYGETFAPMRKLIRTGQVTAPHILMAARITTPLGHGAEGGRGDIFSLEVLTPREARAAVRRVLPYKPDVIKVFTDGWRYGTAPEMTSMEEETLAALVDEAHKNGLKVLTHTVTLERAKIAGRAGVDVIAHSVGDARVDEELIRILREHKTSYVGTLAVYEPRSRNILDPLLDAVLEPAARAAIQPPLTASGNGPATAVSEARSRRFDFMLYNVKALFDAGIRVGTGTDAGVTGTYHGWATQRELELLVRAGLTPMQAIVAATSGSAQAVGLTDRGVIAPGKLADLLIVRGEPDERISDLRNVEQVLVAGKPLDVPMLKQLIGRAEVSPLASQKVGKEIDDFESPDGLSRLKTRWVNATDGGNDHSRMMFGRIARSDGGHALSVMGVMAEKNVPYLRVSVPMLQGGVEPADVSAYKGVRFDVRGSGEYRLVAVTRGVRSGEYPVMPFDARSKWRTAKIQFSQLATKDSTNRWSGKDLLMLTFEIARPAGEQAWLELDNIRFY